MRDSTPGCNANGSLWLVCMGALWGKEEDLNTRPIRECGLFCPVPWVYARHRRVWRGCATPTSASTSTPTFAGARAARRYRGSRVARLSNRMTGQRQTVPAGNTVPSDELGAFVQDRQLEWYIHDVSQGPSLPCRSTMRVTMRVRTARVRAGILRAQRRLFAAHRRVSRDHREPRAALPTTSTLPSLPFLPACPSCAHARCSVQRRQHV
ncbi:hypothetical protein C8Q73DRAFT_153507 [Cubamyces lactineus]|nr:hypothetical protein C8Q73DRAFT_153434 [Cubamyces lactineus]KAH9889287.1 hypothetical protein C8Q73DRAFT_153507 [Cubamyces lactineus]